MDSQGIILATQRSNLLRIKIEIWCKLRVAIVVPVYIVRALQSIRERIEQEEANSMKSKWTSFWENIFTSPRQMVLGFACAAALGAVVAPAALWLMGSDGIGNHAATDGQPQTASVVVESVEIEGNAKTVVFQPQGSDTAVIWIDAGEEVYEEEF